MTSNKQDETYINLIEERINALESRNLFQDDVIEQLSEELAVHQTLISELKEQIQLVANRLKDAGVDAIQVSSHGGRQLDSAPAPIHALREIRKMVGDDYPLFFDSGLRSGEDILKAYAYGADYAFLGRPFSYAIAANGKSGLTEYTDNVASDISIALAQFGLNDISTVSKESICKY